MKTYESSARTIEEAISAGLEVLGASISDVTVDIIDEGSKGLFGLFGSRLAKVRLTVNEQEEVIEDIEDAPTEYTSGESATTGLGALLAGFKFD